MAASGAQSETNWWITEAQQNKIFKHQNTTLRLTSSEVLLYESVSAAPVMIYQFLQQANQSSADGVRLTDVCLLVLLTCCKKKKKDFLASRPSVLCYYKADCEREWKSHDSKDCRRTGTAAGHVHSTPTWKTQVM